MEKGARPSRGWRTLMVMPESFLRQVFRTELAAQGHAVEERSRIDEALAVVNARPPDLVLLDPFVDGGRGPAFLERLRVMEHGLEMPVLITGAVADTRLVRHALALRARGPVPMDGSADLQAWLAVAAEAARLARTA